MVVSRASQVFEETIGRRAVAAAFAIWDFGGDDAVYDGDGTFHVDAAASSDIDKETIGRAAGRADIMPVLFYVGLLPLWVVVGSFFPNEGLWTVADVGGAVVIGVLALASIRYAGSGNIDVEVTD